MRKEFQFSIKNLCCPSSLKNKSYAKAWKSITEYMDIDKIIKRLQDIDKLKMLFLDDNQQKVFEMLPKPGILTKKKPTKNLTQLTFEHIASATKIPKPDDNPINDYAFLMNGDKINRKMLDLLGPSFNEELHMIHIDEAKDNMQIEMPRIMHDSKSMFFSLIQRESLANKINPRNDLNQNYQSSIMESDKL